jgi:hypothetical protein
MVSAFHFWHNICWCGDGTLKSSFLEFYSLARNKKALGSNSIH